MAARGGLVDLFRDLAVRRDKIGSTVRALRRIGDVIFRHGQLQRVRQAARDLHRADIGQLRHDIPGDARAGEREQVVALSHAAGGADLVGSIICRARHLHGAHAEEQHHAQHDGSDDRRHDEDALPDAGIDPAARVVPRALALLLAQLLQVQPARAAGHGAAAQPVLRGNFAPAACAAVSFFSCSMVSTPPWVLSAFCNVRAAGTQRRNELRIAALQVRSPGKLALAAGAERPMTIAAPPRRSVAVMLAPCSSRTPVTTA